MKKAEGRRQSAVGCRRARVLSLVAHTHARRKLCSSSTHRAAAFCLLLTAFCLLSGCAVDEQRGVPPGAQATVERLPTADCLLPSAFFISQSTASALCGARA